MRMVDQKTLSQIYDTVQVISEDAREMRQRSKLKYLNFSFFGEGRDVTIHLNLMARAVIA